MGPPFGYHDKRICLTDVRPSGRQMPQIALLVVEVDPRLSPREAAKLQAVTAPPQRMEGVGHPENFALILRIGSSRRRS